MDKHSSANEKFVMLFSKSQPDIRRYIYSLCLNMGDTEDILQETSLALWRKFETYDSTKPFLNWAFRFAYFEVMKFKEKNKRSISFCETTLKILSEEHADDLEQQRAQRRILKQCVRKLPDDEQELIALRYSEKMSVASINEMFSETGKKIYRAFERIRSKLQKCVEVTLSEEGWS
jgi:RNA polymerase sigma-70 factor, ECF subfamily